MVIKKGKGYFSISAVAKMFAIHQQTIRMYEKEGFINPKRSDGNTRLFSEEDVKRLEEIVYLTHTVGINLAGVEMILKLKKQIKKMQHEMNGLFKKANQELDAQTHQSRLLIEKSSEQLLYLKNQKQKPALQQNRYDFSSNQEKNTMQALDDNTTLYTKRKKEGDNVE